MLPKLLNPGDSSLDYTNPAHAATLAVMMQHAQISGGSCSAPAPAAPASPSPSPVQRPRGPPARASSFGGEALDAGISDDDAPSSAAAASSPPRRISRRSSLASSTPAPRRSSLRCSSPPASPDGSPPVPGQRRRQQRRRSSVTFNSEADETKVVPPKVECPVLRRELFYEADDYTKFRREHVREKRAEQRERREMMSRWRSTFGSGPKKSSAAAHSSSAEFPNGDSASSSPKMMPFARIKSTVSASTKTSSSSAAATTQFSANFKRSVVHSRTSSSSTAAASGGGRVTMGGLRSQPAVRTARLA